MRAALTLAALVLVLAPALAAAPASAQELEVVRTQQLSPRMSELTVRTPALAADARLRIVLPDGYGADPSRRYPVVYLLHGTDNDPSTLTDNLDIEAFTRPLPVIVVMPEGGRGSYYTDWYNGGAGGPPEWERFHVAQLIPFIDGRLRTVAGRAGRGVIGISMGGFGAMSYAARHPDTFAAAASLSGAVNSNFAPGGAAVTASPFLFEGGMPDAAFGPRATQEVRWRAHNPWDLAGNLRGLDLQILTHDGRPGGPHGGGPDGIEVLVHQMSTDLHDRLRDLGIAHAWHDYGAGTHEWTYFQDKLHVALSRMMAVLADPRPEPAAFAYASAEPSFSVWGWRVRADPRRAMEFLEVRRARRDGLTLTGSGLVDVVTPPLFRGLRAVDALGAHDGRALRPDRRGRLSFTVDLGAPHEAQQYTPQAQADGQAGAGYFTTRSVRLDPHPVIRIGRAVLRRGSLRVRVRALGAPVAGVRIVVRDAAGRRVGHSRPLALGLRSRVVRVGMAGVARRRGRYRVTASGRDGEGRPVRAVRNA